jgi:hypothetical protein
MVFGCLSSVSDKGSKCTFLYDFRVEISCLISLNLQKISKNGKNLCFYLSFIGNSKYLFI